MGTPSGLNQDIHSKDIYFIALHRLSLTHSFGGLGDLKLFLLLEV